MYKVYITHVNLVGGTLTSLNIQYYNDVYAWLWRQFYNNDVDVIIMGREYVDVRTIHCRQVNIYCRAPVLLVAPRGRANGHTCPRKWWHCSCRVKCWIQGIWRTIVQGACRVCRWWHQTAHKRWRCHGHSFHRGRFPGCSERGMHSQYDHSESVTDPCLLEYPRVRWS